MGGMIPAGIPGPKLGPFRGNVENIEFLKLLAPDEGQLEKGDIPHARVFLVKIGGVRYVMKIFNFFDVDDLRPFYPYKTDHILTDSIVRYQLDPFYAECRAFRLLVEKKKDNLLAVRCHGYAFLPPAVEHRIERQFGEYFAVEDWNRGPEDQGQPLRAIIKDYIPSKSPYGRRRLSVIKSNIEKLNDLGIFNMDIYKWNLLGGRLFDFSIAIRCPHIFLTSKFRSIKIIDEDIELDRGLFEALEARELERRAEVRATFRARLRRERRR